MTYASQRQIELDAIVQTDQLQLRKSRPRNYDAETHAFGSLAQLLANPPRDILQCLADAALDLCQAGSAGISIIEEHLGEKVFRWHALSGALTSHRWGTTPRDFSPCGTVIDRNSVQLMLLPERHFLYFANVKPQIVEGLLVPFSVGGQPVGTIWVVSHEAGRQFDGEDARLVEELGQFATKAYQFASSVAVSKIADRRKDAFLAALGEELRSPLSAIGREIGGMKDRARDIGNSTSPPISALGERQLKAMKRVITGLLDRSRTSFEALSAASDSTLDQDTLQLDCRPPLARSRTLPLPFGPAGNVSDPMADGCSYSAEHRASEELSLLVRMRRGEQLALEALYDLTVGSVYALACSILKNREDAEEVVCDTYARAWRQSNRFDAQRASPLGWLLMMCRSQAIDRLRYNRSRGSVKMVPLEAIGDIANDALMPDELLSLFHNGSRVQSALGALSPQRLKLIGLAFFEGLSFHEIAERTTLPLGTVKSDIRRAMVELRRKLQSVDRVTK